MLEIAFTPDRGGEVALVRRLIEHLAEPIGGRLAAGSKLSPTREAAAALGVGRNTVSAAYAARATRGFVTAHVGQGTYPDRLEQAARDRGVAYTRGEVFHVDGRGAGHLALSFAPLDPRAIAEGIARLAAVVGAQGASPRAPGRTRPAAARPGSGKRRPAGRSIDGAR